MEDNLKQEIAWYKRTYENRSLLGIIKDRVLKKITSFLKKKTIPQTIQSISTENEVELPPNIPHNIVKKDVVNYYDWIYYNTENRHENAVAFNTIKDRFYINTSPKALNYKSKKVDIIVPIYNGLEYLKILIPQILKNSDIPFNLMLINDCSPDKKVALFLNSFRDNKNVTIINNKKNLGFTGTINKALNETKNDVVLLNSDTEVPAGWLSRLFKPIFEDETVATVTPFSNSATIASFPRYDDNHIFENTTVDELDQIFNSITKPIYIEIPTGVGFCMAMSRNAINKVGFLDEKNFPIGYGEEVDWCRRAIKNELKNVFIPNLFVYHKHGGSFSSEDKKRLSTEHQIKLEQLHPSFMPDVREFFTNSIQDPVRQLLLLYTINNITSNTLVYFDHELGGGANIYTSNFVKENKETALVITVTFIHPNYNKHDKLAVRYRYKEYSNTFTVNSLDELIDFFANIKISKIVIGSFITYPNLKDTMITIKKLISKSNCNSEYLIHDYHSLCTQFTLMYQGKEFCNIPDYKKCESCKASEIIPPVLINKDFTTLKDYRKLWSSFLNKDVKQITCFSESSLKILEKVHPDLDKKKIRIIPHKIEKLKPLVIGIIGNIYSSAKGGNIIKEMSELIIKNGNPNNINIIVFGEISSEFNTSNIQKSGAYHRGELYNLVRKNFVDIILIPSICPETFSYTTAEAITLKLPVFSFNLGGQSDQVKKYEKGVIIEEISAETALNTIIEYAKN